MQTVSVRIISLTSSAIALVIYSAEIPITTGLGSVSVRILTMLFLVLVSSFLVDFNSELLNEKDKGLFFIK